LAKRDDLQQWVLEALRDIGGSGNIVQVAKHLWKHHEQDLRASGDMFFTWQYDMRWACTKLRERRLVQPAEESARGEWKLYSKSPS
jgi:hypothetical protein